MNKKILLLALGAVSATMLAVPAMASGLVPLHLSPQPVGAKTIDDVGTDPTLSSTGGITVNCDSFTGNATFEAGGTTGTMNLTFGPNCRTNPFNAPCTNTGVSGDNRISTTTLPFHLVTVDKNDGNNVAGVLVTPNNGHFATFTCHVPFFPQTIKVEGSGVIGAITSPACGGKSTEATIDFNATGHGVQELTKVVGTETVYGLKKGAENSAQDATGKVTFGETEHTLTCT